MHPGKAAPFKTYHFFYIIILMMKKILIASTLVLLPIALALLPLLLPIILVYGLSAINLRIGYSKMFCSGPQPTVKDQILRNMESRGLPVPMWLKRPSKTCNP
ncbi:membrane protein [Candidatus Magnetobacterium bavaricum]|uniref:Membrane protein n=1 Tax=Candidatus Magnetobacterium bavaricum TaxID=29290 RepID=A0A0F3GXH4_9BACT|nr:membrane protein [Candidatus Magnetobacterium bavaricum]